MINCTYTQIDSAINSAINSIILILGLLHSTVLTGVCSGAWQLPIDRNALADRWGPPVAKAANRWIGRRSASGHISRQELASMVPAELLGVERHHMVLPSLAAALTGPVAVRVAALSATVAVLAAALPDISGCSLLLLVHRC